MEPFNFDVQELLRQSNNASSRTTKRAYIKEGYSHQLSLYGVARIGEEGESRYARIEILANTPWTERIVALLYEWFSYMVMKHKYTIWIYDGHTDSFKIVGEYE
jgi:hypothetical protein